LARQLWPSFLFYMTGTFTFPNKLKDFFPWSYYFFHFKTFSNILKHSTQFGKDNLFKFFTYLAGKPQTCWLDPMLFKKSLTIFCFEKTLAS
jgi:hypothetical protein